MPCSVPVNVTVTFTSTWCALTQPYDFSPAAGISVDFPDGPPAATAYSGAAHQGFPLAVTHSSAYSLWGGGVGAPASDCLRNISTAGFATECIPGVAAAVADGSAAGYVVGDPQPACGVPNAPSPAAPQTITLPVDAAHSMLSVLFMLAPSPDWFTGVQSLDLCVDGYWRSRSLSTQPYDSGVDSATTFVHVDSDPATGCCQDPTAGGVISMISGGTDTPFTSNVQDHTGLEIVNPVASFDIWLPSGAPSSTANGFVPYYNYVGALAVSGSVGPVTTSGTTQSFWYSLSGVDPACSGGGGTAPNSCGIHIHSGTSCSADAGAHYYVNPPITSDPWTSIGYTSVGGMASGMASVNTGGGAADIVGRAVVIHDLGGARVACALLAEQGAAAYGGIEFEDLFSFGGSCPTVNLTLADGNGGLDLPVHAYCSSGGLVTYEEYCDASCNCSSSVASAVTPGPSACYRANDFTGLFPSDTRKFFVSLEGCKGQPSASPTTSPIASPSMSPTQPGETLSPTATPTTIMPSAMPTYENWTASPTTLPTASPSGVPSTTPSLAPSTPPSASPTPPPTQPRQAPPPRVSPSAPPTPTASSSAEANGSAPTSARSLSAPSCELRELREARETRDIGADASDDWMRPSRPTKVPPPISRRCWL